MFDNIGGKIKVLAKVLCWIGIIGFVILAFVMFDIGSKYYSNVTERILGWVFLIGGPLISWIISFFIYGFGELIEKATQIEINTRKVKKDDKEKNKGISSLDKKQERAGELLNNGFISQEEYNQIVE